MNARSRHGVKAGRKPREVEAPPAGLEEAARRACMESRAFSARPRGAAILTAGGRIFASPEIAAADEIDPRGTVAMCAERTALYRALMAGADRPRALLIRGGRGGRGDGGAPCGACLQVLAEFAPGLRVFWGTAARPRGGLTVRALLPGAFDRGHLHPGSGGSGDLR